MCLELETSSLERIIGIPLEELISTANMNSSTTQRKISSVSKFSSSRINQIISDKTKSLEKKFDMLQQRLGLLSCWEISEKPSSNRTLSTPLSYIAKLTSNVNQAYVVDFLCKITKFRINKNLMILLVIRKLQCKYEYLGLIDSSKASLISESNCIKSTG